MELTETAVEQKEKYGEKLEYDPTGPFKKTREPTDRGWLIGYVVYLIVWMIVVIYGFAKGDTSRWLGPTDSEGRVCGQDEGVVERRYLVQHDRESCGNETDLRCLVCHTSCPAVDFNYASVSAGGASLDEVKALMICKPEVKLEAVKNWTQLDHLVGKGKCAGDYRRADGIDGQCDVPESRRYESNEWKYILPRVDQDLSNAKYSIIGFVALSGLISLLCILLMRWYALAFVCGSIFVLCALVFHSIYQKCLSDAQSKTNGVLLALFICVLVLSFVVFLAVYFRRQIHFASQMIRESSKAITSVLSSLAFPLLLCGLYLLLLTLGLSTHLVLTSLEEPVYKAEFAEAEFCDCPELNYDEGSICDPKLFERDCRTPDGFKCILSSCYVSHMQAKSVGFLHFVNFFGMYWSFWFVLGFGDFVLASVFATWYWTFNKKILSYLTLVESFWRVSIYHLGTVAFGSFLIAICSIIRFIINITYKKLKKSKRPYVIFCVASVSCCFDLVERFVEFIHRRAFIMSAVHGTDFIQSAKAAFYLTMRNVEKVIPVCQITSWLMLLLASLVTLIITRISIDYYATRTEDLTFVTLPPVLVFVGCFFVTLLLFRVVQLAVDTIFYSFLEDTERNDGSYEKPYFMSEELTKFLYRK